MSCHSRESGNPMDPKGSPIKALGDDNLENLGDDNLENLGDDNLEHNDR